MEVRTERDATDFIRRMADYERMSAILWLVLSIIQICSCVAMIAGVWNLFASLSRFAMATRIRARDPGVPKAFEGLGQLVLIGLINFFLGAVVGVVFVVLDFHIRDQILNNKHVFSNEFVGEVALESTGRAPVSNRAQQLQRAIDLYERGLLSSEEFANEKRRLLGG